MAKVAAKTSIMPMALVAIEQYFPEAQRVVKDDLAVRLLPPGAKIFVRLLRLGWLRDRIIRLSEKSNPGIWGGMLCRKRYIDEKLVASRNQIEAVVNLGAGFDTRAYRSWDRPLARPCAAGAGVLTLSGLPVWEVDQRENIVAKAKRLRKAAGAIPANVKLVPADFDHDELGSILAAGGYSETKPTFFVWEAVTQYLTEEGVRTTFNWLANAAKGSRLAFTYVRKSFLDGRNTYGWENGYKRFVATKVWRFGMEPEDCPDFLKRYGWRVIEDVGYDKLAERYLVTAGRRLASTAVERMVYAEKNSRNVATTG